MNKDEKIEYLNKVVKYLNLSAICDLYNINNGENRIDYNNLRVTLKKQSESRLSEDKLDSFICFLHNYLIPQVFDHSETMNSINKQEIANKIDNEILELRSKILGVLK